MNLSELLDMVAEVVGGRIAVGDHDGTLTYSELQVCADRLAAQLEHDEGRPVVFLGANTRALPIALFGAARCGAPFVPVNYRLSDAELARIVDRSGARTAIVDDDMYHRLDGVDGMERIRTSDVVTAPIPPERTDSSVRGAASADVALMLFTSGTTGEPKAAILRHGNLMSYVLSTLDFLGAEEDEVGLVSVPPYHIAGISAIVSSMFTGRAIVYLRSFDPAQWVELVRRHAVTHAMVVPTMLNRILDVVDADASSLSSLRVLAYGGGKMPLTVIERALTRLQHVGFVNAYGLTETSSTIAVLGPDDHRTAFKSDEVDGRRRLGSVGRPHAGVQVEVRDPLGDVVGPMEPGEIWVRGPQVSGQYLARDARVHDGWFPTNDGGMLDEEGYLYVTGRLDDVIVRGGENLSPGEIEEVLLSHPHVQDAAVIGVPSVEWGETIAAFVVASAAADVSADGLKAYVRDRLRSNRVPEFVYFRSDLPYSETGKLLRRELRTLSEVR